jgi:nicotinate-nucleotide adenylyltransferase
MRLALFGGTFDPIHNAHLTVAREAADRFSLDRVLFVPAANPPHKPESGACFEDRYRMVELACAADARFIPSRLEAGEETSYSVVTVEKVREAGQPLFFIIGADAFAEITTWYRWRDLVDLAEFIVVTRRGHEYRSPDGARVHRLDTVDLPASSSEIRHQLAAGTISGELPSAVAEYIRERGLYRLHP